MGHKYELRNLIKSTAIHPSNLHDFLNKIIPEFPLISSTISIIFSLTGTELAMASIGLIKSMPFAESTGLMDIMKIEKKDLTVQFASGINPIPQKTQVQQFAL